LPSHAVQYVWLDATCQIGGVREGLTM